MSRLIEITKTNILPQWPSIHTTPLFRQHVCSPRTLVFPDGYGMLEKLRHRLSAYPTLSQSPNMRSERRIAMTKRQMAFGVICFLIGILIGMEIAGNPDVLFRLVIVVAILLLCVYLVLPLPTTKHTSPLGSSASATPMGWQHATAAWRTILIRPEHTSGKPGCSPC
jgi:hypothetical protein